MIVSGLPIWIVTLIALVITIIYYFRYRKTWMSHWLIVALIFALHFFFFAWGVVIFLITEIIRSKVRDSKKTEI